MTDEEPEPFRMPTTPDAEEPAAEEPAAEEPAAEEPAADDTATAAAESIADLISEAARTAAAQSEAEHRGELPEDRSADVWGEPVDVPVKDADAVWQQAEDDAGSNVWDLDEDGSTMWGPEAAEPTEPTTPTATDDPIPPRDGAAGPPAAAEGMPDGDEVEPETFTFAVGDGGATPPAGSAAGPTPGPDREDDEPDTFSFPAGPDTTAPAPLPDHTDQTDRRAHPDHVEDEDEEPETFTFAVADDEPLGSAAPPEQHGDTTDATSPAEDWPVPGAGAADETIDEMIDETIDADTDVWTFTMTTDQDTSPQDAPLADAATPRDAAGWHDLEAEEEPGWEVADLTAQPDAAEDESDGFSAAIQALADDEDDEDDDAVWSAPALDDDDELPTATPVTARAKDAADGVAAEVQDALGDLLGTGDEDPVAEASAPSERAARAADDAADAAAAADAGLDDFDHLDELDDLDHLDDMAAAAVPAVGHDADDASSEDEEDFEIEEPLDAPAAARRVMEPGAVTFSSGGKKKRGLFG